MTFPTVTRPAFAALREYWMAMARWSELLFVVVVAIISIGLSLIAGYGLSHFGFHQSERSELLKYGVGSFFALATVFAPLVETLLFQQFPILVAKRLGMSVILQIAVGSLPFAATHFSSGVISGVAAGIVGGVIYSLVYLTFASQSRTKAFALTAAVHSMHNLLAGAAMYFLELS